MEIVLPLQPRSVYTEYKYGIHTNVTTATISKHRNRVSSLTHKSPAKSITTLCTEVSLTDSIIKAYASLLQACTNSKQLKNYHAHMLRTGLYENTFLLNKLVSVYAMTGDMEDARLLFDGMWQPKVFAWNAMIRGFAKKGLPDEALSFYYQMHMAGVQPDRYTFPFVFYACAALLSLQDGKQIHAHIICSGFELNLYTETALLDMYAKCGCIESAHCVFDKMSRRDVISWNALIAGYAQCGEDCEALALFNYMLSIGQKPNGITVMSVLPPCAYLGALQLGKGIHGYVIRNCLEDVPVMTSLIDMYAKCGSIEMAEQLFNNMFERDAVAWTALISGYAQNGYADEALALFNEMLSSYVKPSLVTMASVVSVCANLAALQHGEWIHAYIIQSGFESSIYVGNSLIDMYAKCGSIDTAHKVFDRMSERDLISWNSLISGYGMHGQGEEALAIFQEMQKTGIKPDTITFLAVFSACSHAGLVDEGWQYFNAMRKKYCILPKLEHYACMVDLLGRAGHLDEAMDLIENMPLKPSTDVWITLLGACRLHGNIELGEQVAEHIFDLDPKNKACYILLSNIYAAAGRWDNVTKWRTTMRDMGLKKEPGCSLIQVRNRVYSFLVGDRSHPQSEKIYALLESLAVQMREAGYVPNIDVVLHNVEDEVKEDMLSCHSEKLAIAFGLINISPGVPIRIIKNLRVCGDCHSATKFISKIVNREIIVRDANRFHHFKDGMCTCRDYW